MNLKDKIANLVAELRLRVHRGMSYIYEIKSAVLMAVSLKILVDINTITTIFLTILLLVMFFVLGYIDTKYLYWMQTENKLSTSKYNPHLNKLSEIEMEIKNV